MNTLTAQTTIELPCDCAWCAGELAARTGETYSHTFAVCVVDGERRMTLAFDGSPDTDTGWTPPAWLTELTEPCKTCHGLTDAERQAPCDCIDGHPAVEVVLSSEVIGKPHRPKRVTELGRGTVEHILPVLPYEEHPTPDADHIEIYWDDRIVTFWVLEADGSYGMQWTFNLTVTPGQYVILIRLEES